ncbi:tetratricopeptide repeat protein [uncultured Tateyamaria sp.]|uniref:tetratricopeptide repeat protein n=1 Tax=uncultured Tateyamaria sp. TaxID=455651 RepID=UPI0026093FB3|nr:tetratricopeptide repeat protein [uncultured Tateyamaria sp.]
MTLCDSYGNAIATQNSIARDCYDQGVRQFLGADYGACKAFQACVDADPDFALGHAALARALMMEGRMPEAKQAIARAQTLANGSDDRESGHLAAFAALLDGRPHDARNIVQAHVRDYPRDALAAQLCTNVFGLIGFSGEVGREAELLAYTEALLPHYEGDWWMMSMHALSLCETGRIAASRSLMEKSLALNPRNANGAHFWSHAQYEAGDITAGRAYLSEWIKDYDSRAVLHGHLSWHIALWALHDGDEVAMWDVVDNGVTPGASDSLPINVLTDTAAILYRAELAGIAIQPERWKDLSAYAARYFPETGQSFADMHAALCHAMAGDGERLAHIAETAKGFAGDLVRPVARGWGDIARGNWTGALEHLSEVMATTERLGGSRAQRDLIELAYVNVLMKLGHSEEAHRTLRLRRPVLTNAPPVSGMH